MKNESFARGKYNTFKITLRIFETPCIMINNPIQKKRKIIIKIMFYMECNLYKNIKVIETYKF